MLSRFCGLGASLALVAAAVLVAPASVHAQSQDERDVIAVVQRIFDAMPKCDGATVLSLSMPEGRLHRLLVGGDAALRSMTLEEFAASITKCGRKMLERMWEPQVRVHKGIATLWAPYDFWLDGTFSHCGIDTFHLAKTPDGWKLAGGAYTVEREGCAPSPLGAPAGQAAR